MKFVDEYRSHEAAQKIICLIHKITTKPWAIMEVCGGQTHSIVKYGLDRLLPPQIELLHGPGCPVCVTPLETIDRAHAIASQENVTFFSFGDMLRVPGSKEDLLQLKSSGKDIRIVYSPLDAVNFAQKNPDRRVVFFAIGFETTAPANAMAVVIAQRLNLKNFSILTSHVLVPPSMASILQAPDNRVQAFLGPGHVCAITGFSEYESISKNYRVPVVVTGFEPLDLLEGVYQVVRQLEKGEAKVENQYARAVQSIGNIPARKVVDEVFEVCDRKWRGVGTIPKSGLKLRFEYRDFDAEKIFEVQDIETNESKFCMSGMILKGLMKPNQCPAFGSKCTPMNPLGATMVSSEGACAAYYNYGRFLETQMKKEACR